MATVVTYDARAALGPARLGAVSIPLSLAAVLEKTRAAVAEAGLWVVGELDPQMLLAKGGYDIPPTRQLLVFHPRFMAPLLASAPAAIDEAPLKFVLLSGGATETVLRYPQPSMVFAPFATLAPLAAELDGLVGRIVAAVKA